MAHGLRLVMLDGLRPLLVKIQRQALSSQHVLQAPSPQVVRAPASTGQISEPRFAFSPCLTSSAFDTVDEISALLVESQRRAPLSQHGRQDLPSLSRRGFGLYWSSYKDELCHLDVAYELYFGKLEGLYPLLNKFQRCALPFRNV